MNKKLIRIGFFSELKYGRATDPSLKGSVQPAADPEDAKFVSYLRLGKQMAMAPGVSRDVIDNSIIGGMAILTDGTYSWPSDLAHYIERHHVRPPEELVAHARSNDFAMPSFDTSLLEL